MTLVRGSPKGDGFPGWRRTLSDLVATVGVVLGCMFVIGAIVFLPVYALFAALAGPPVAIWISLALLMADQPGRSSIPWQRILGGLLVAASVAVYALIDTAFFHATLAGVQLLIMAGVIVLGRGVARARRLRDGYHTNR